MKLENLFNHLLVKKIEGTLPSTEINKITQDTREVEPGDVFVCISGVVFDGHEYVETAIEKGAIAIVAERKIETSTGNVPIIYVKESRKAITILASAFYKHPSEELSMIGVTGTNGKTTVTHLIDHILKKAGKKTGMIGTIGMDIDGEQIPVLNTTPDNITLQRSLRMMVDRDVEVCSMEFSSHALVQGRTWGIDVDVAVLTNLTHEHLDFHKTMEDYQHAKELLFSQLGNSWKNGKGKIAILNKDDATYQPYSQATAAEVISYSIEDETADFFAKDIHFEKDGTTFTLVVMGNLYPVQTRLMGAFNVSNALAALAAVFSIGFPLEEAVELLSEAQGARGRLQALTDTGDIQVYVDFAHTPDGLEKALQALKPITNGRLVNVMGVMGNRDQQKRPKMGRIAAENADHVIFTMENPETEPQSEITDMLLKGVETENYTIIEDRSEAIFHAIVHAQSGDTVAITGRGHETTYRVGTTIYHLVDEEVAREAIEERKRLQQDTI